jgi:myo-inositol-1(or 4)-monophosphatase
MPTSDARASDARASDPRASDAQDSQPELWTELRRLAEQLATTAGTGALGGRRGLTLDTESKSSRTDLVTEFDREAEQVIVDQLRQHRPQDSIIGEEGAAVSGDSGFEWLIDPIDGTTNYVYDLPSWCTSVAVAHRGQMVAGAVYVPVTDELFSAALGGGATMNRRSITCSDRSELSLALVATGFGYRAEDRSLQAARLAQMIGEIRDVRRLGSAALDLCHVAIGRVDAYFEEHLNAWDAAAGLLIATEAGAVASDFEGEAARPAQLVVTTPALHAPLLELIQNSR